MRYERDSYRKWDNALTSIIGINIVIRRRMNRTKGHPSLYRATYRVACRDMKGKLMCRYFVVGTLLNPRYEPVGYSSTRKAWKSATKAYAEHMGIRRPKRWWYAPYVPKRPQFDALVDEYIEAGVEFSQQEIELFNRIR